MGATMHHGTTDHTGASGMLKVGMGAAADQVVRRALDEGYEVRCTVRPRQNPADFLRDWGATTVKVRVLVVARRTCPRFSDLQPHLLQIARSRLPSHCNSLIFTNRSAMTWRARA